MANDSTPKNSPTLAQKKLVQDIRVLARKCEKYKRELLFNVVKVGELLILHLNQHKYAAELGVTQNESNTYRAIARAWVKQGPPSAALGIPNKEAIPEAWIKMHLTDIAALGRVSEPPVTPTSYLIDHKKMWDEADKLDEKAECSLKVALDKIQEAMKLKRTSLFLRIKVGQDLNNHLHVGKYAKGTGLTERQCERARAFARAFLKETGLREPLLLIENIPTHWLKKDFTLAQIEKLGAERPTEETRDQKKECSKKGVLNKGQVLTSPEHPRWVALKAECPLWGKEILTKDIVEAMGLRRRSSEDQIVVDLLSWAPIYRRARATLQCKKIEEASGYRKSRLALSVRMLGVVEANDGIIPTTWLGLGTTGIERLLSKPTNGPSTKDSQAEVPKKPMSPEMISFLAQVAEALGAKKQLRVAAEFLISGLMSSPETLSLIMVRKHELGLISEAPTQDPYVEVQKIYHEMLEKLKPYISSVPVKDYALQTHQNIWNDLLFGDQFLCVDP